MEDPMLTILTLILSHAAALGAGVFFSPKIEAWFASWTAARAIAAAKKLVDTEIARITALENARAAIAAHKATTPAATGPAGATGA